MLHVICDYCGRSAKLVTGKDIYPHRPDLHELRFWECKECDAYVGAHKASDEHAPLGRLANSDLRAAKSEAHKAFDKMWKSGDFSRSQAYKWLSTRLGISKKDCHIGMFNISQCEKVVLLCGGKDYVF